MKHVVSFDSVTVKIGSRIIIEEASFFLEDGKSAWLKGRNGEGKSTIIKCISGLVPFKGRISVNSFLIGSMDARAYISYCPDEPALLDDMTLDQHAKFTSMLSGNREVYDYILEFYRRFNIEKFADELPIGHSRGTRQKASLSLALALQRPLTLLDEPFNGLDVYSRGVLKNILIKEMYAGKSFLFTTHQEGDVENYFSEVEENISVYNVEEKGIKLNE